MKNNIRLILCLLLFGALAIAVVAQCVYGIGCGTVCFQMTGNLTQPSCPACKPRVWWQNGGGFTNFCCAIPCTNSCAEWCEDEDLDEYAIEDGLVYGTDNCPTSCGTVVTLKEISYNCSLIIEWDVGDCFIAENQSKSPLLLSSVKGEYAGSPHSDQAFTHNIGLSVKPHP